MPDVKPIMYLIAGHPGYELWNMLDPVNARMKIWINYVRLSVGGRLPWLKLNEAGDGPDAAVGHAMYAGPPHPDYYRFIKTFFQKAGYDTQSPQLDWRTKMEVIGPALANQMIAAAEKTRLNVICHSAGGLYLRFALKWLAQRANVNDVINRIVGIHCAHWGAWHTCQAIRGVVGYVKEEIDLVRTVGTVLNAQNAADYVRDVIHSFWNLYQLLPDPAAPPISANIPGMNQEKADFIYTAKNWEDGMRPLSQKKLDYARAEWSTISKTWTGQPWLSICGDRLLTGIGADSRFPIGAPGSIDYASAGDGVLPYAWQTIPGMEVAGVFGVNHDACMQNTVISQMALNYFGDGR